MYIFNRYAYICIYKYVIIYIYIYIYIYTYRYMYVSGPLSNSGHTECSKLTEARWT